MAPVSTYLNLDIPAIEANNRKALELTIRFKFVKYTLLVLLAFFFVSNVFIAAIACGRMEDEQTARIIDELEERSNGRSLLNDDHTNMNIAIAVVSLLVLETIVGTAIYGTIRHNYAIIASFAVVLLLPAICAMFMNDSFGAPYMLIEVFAVSFASMVKK